MQMKRAVPWLHSKEEETGEEWEQGCGAKGRGVASMPTARTSLYSFGKPLAFKDHAWKEQSPALTLLPRASAPPLCLLFFNIFMWM